MSATGIDLARTRELLGRYVDECPWFWERNTDKRQCQKLWGHLDAIEEAFGLSREAALDHVAMLGESRLADRPATIYISGRGGSGSHWLAEMLEDLDGFANAGEVSIPVRLVEGIAGWPWEEQGLLVDCVNLLHAWAGSAFPGDRRPPVAHPDVGQLHLVNSNGGTSLFHAKQWEPRCVFIHLIRDPREQVMSFTYRKPGAHANYPIEPVEDFLRLMLIFNRVSAAEVITAGIAPDLVCRFEDLRIDAAGELHRIVRRAGIDVSEESIEEVAWRHSAEARRQGLAPLGNLSKTPVSGWRATATPWEKAMMHAGLAEVVDTLGYAPDHCLGRPVEFVPNRSRLDLHLGSDVVLGELHVRGAEDDDWQRFGYAAGSFELPAGVMVRLRCPGARTTELESLTELLPAGGIASLCLAGNLDVTDRAIADLAGRPGLLELDLARTCVTDASVEALATLTGLRHLSVAGSGMSAAAVARLERALPNCEVFSAPLITETVRGRSMFDEELITEPPQ